MRELCVLVQRLASEHGPPEFNDWLADAMQPQSDRVADEIAFMFAAGGEVQRG